MANIITSLNEFDVLFADFVTNKLNMNANKVLISYPKEGQIMPRFNEDVCFVYSSEEFSDVQLYKSRKEEYIESTNKWKTSQASMRRITVNFTFYGANCDRNSILLKEMMYFPGTNEWLHQNNLALIPSDITLVNKVREKIDNRFWERAELTISFYNSTVVEEEVNMIEGLDLEVKTQF